MAEPPVELFRKEALEHHAGYHAEGDLLRISPAWSGWAYWLLLACCASGLLYAVLGSIYHYASGPAVVRAEGRTDLTAKQAGTVATVEVRPGQLVSEGQILVRFDVTPESGDLERVSREFELLLVRTLRDPTDQAARQSLTALRAQKELAQARLEERTVRAPQQGVVRDLRIRQGQLLKPGETILSLHSAAAGFSVVAMLPGHYRPQLRAGMLIRLELTGYPYEYKELAVSSIGDEVVGPAEVRRYLPQEIADAVTLTGPVVLVHARLPSATFQMEGRALPYYEGMQGTADVRVRAESMVFTLVPGLKLLLPRRWR